MAARHSGQFKKGWKGGPGRPKRVTEREYLDAVIGAVPMKQWLLVVDRAVADAVAGDHRARDWLSKYLLPADGAGAAQEAETTTTTGPTTFVFTLAERPPTPEPGDSV